MLAFLNYVEPFPWSDSYDNDLFLGVAFFVTGFGAAFLAAGLGFRCGLGLGLYVVVVPLRLVTLALAGVM